MQGENNMQVMNEEKLIGVDERLCKLVRLVNEEIKICVCCGYRGKEEQDRAFLQGLSKLKYPKSKHNKTPAKAVDLAPLTIDNKINWKDINSFILLNNCVQKHASILEIKIIWGGGFKIRDYVHYELG